jgi:hypothetical protein
MGQRAKRGAEAELLSCGARRTYVAMLWTVILGEVVLKNLGAAGIVAIGLALNALRVSAKIRDVIGMVRGRGAGWEVVCF